MSDKPLKKFPTFETDEEAERFVDEADLSEYDFSEFRPVNFKMTGEGVVMVPVLPDDLQLEAKAAADAKGMDYVDFMRDAVKKAS